MSRNPRRGKSQRVLVIPDSQNGYRGTEPIHDRLAWAGAVAVARAVEPDVVVMLGDMLDLAPFGKYRVTNDLLGTTQRTLDETHIWLEKFVAVSDRRVYIEGNHEARFNNTLLDANRELASLRGLDIATLLGLGDMGYEYVGPYGAGVDIDGVLYTHGDKYAKWGGATAAKYLQEYPCSVVFGHCHHVEVAFRRWVGGKITFAASPGTLARVDGIVPGSKPSCGWTQSVLLVENDTPTPIRVGGNEVYVPGFGVLRPKVSGQCRGGRRC